jgi:hypothetical protein
VTAQRLNGWLQAQGYPVPRLAFAPLSGYLKGFIDLVFCHDDRFYVLDWKSNHLGIPAADYGEQPMATAMAEHGYHLQYLLYCVALHRYLRSRIADYAYDRHFGGVLYLFVRGVRPGWQWVTASGEAKPAASITTDLRQHHRLARRAALGQFSGDQPPMSALAPAAFEPPAANGTANDLAEGFARHLVAWAEAEGASADSLAVLAAAARQSSLATQAGHVCARLQCPRRPFPTSPPPSYAAVCSPAAWSRASKRVSKRPRHRPLPCRCCSMATGASTSTAISPTSSGWRRTCAGARGTARRLPATPCEDSSIALFAANAERLGGRPDWQKLAAALAWRGRLTIISGGPGTGKTTTVVALLACLLGENPGLRIALAAPTGKAAARMLEALRSQRAGTLAPELQALLPRESHTLHRLLGVTPEAGRFRHHAGNPLPIDALVVDEASMLDLALACRLCEAVPPAARLILLGDKDQLAAVEAGAVFAELSADPTLSPACVAELAALTATPAPQIPRRPPSPRRRSSTASSGFPRATASPALRGSADWPARSTPAAAHRRVTGSRAAKTGRSAG